MKPSPWEPDLLQEPSAIRPRRHAAIRRARDGCWVEDVDGNRYIDYVLGLMPIVLGYRDPDVDEAICAQLQLGITFSLPTALEADLAERLVRLIPCAEKVRFGKNGSDATSAALRLARAHTGRDKVLVCGYHGWHDWCIGATSRRLGIPKAVCDLTVAFPYNRPEAVAELLAKEPDGFAAVILEPVGVEAPAPGFLARLRELTERYGVVLVFDEIVTGFRINLGGAQAEFGVAPDLACSARRWPTACRSPPSSDAAKSWIECTTSSFPARSAVKRCRWPPQMPRSTSFARTSASSASAPMAGA